MPEDAGVAGASSAMSTRLLASCGCVDCHAGGELAAAPCDGEMERGATPGIAVHPDATAHEFDEAFADGEAEASAPKWRVVEAST